MKVHNLTNEEYLKIYPVIDQDKCCGDALCVNDCIRRCLVMDENNKAQYKAINMDCFQCGHCIAICPKNAISFAGVDSNELAQGKIELPTDKLEHAIRMRRSIRDFKESPIPHEDIEKAIETASYAPSGGNKQGVSWVLVSSKDKLHEVTGLCAKALAEYDSPNPAQKKVFQALNRAFQKGRNLISYNAPHVIFTHAPREMGMNVIDSTIAISYLELVLNSMGIGTCWVGYMSMAANFDTSINKYLGIPEENIVTGAILLGYPKLKFPRSVMRKNITLQTI